MSQPVILPNVARLLDKVDAKARHVGLALDKFSPARKQDEQKETLKAICGAAGDQRLLTSLIDHRSKSLLGASTQTWTATTTAPLTLHLSRANALENAGIALHPLYGFAYLPGSGLKGVARAYAETIWLPTQPDQDAGCADIVNVFGCAPGSDAGKDPPSDERGKAKDGQAGAVVFHDAWPEKWPKLFVDIAAVHHRKYYEAKEGAVPPPGDWEKVDLISFLAIKPGIEFRFAVAPRGASSRADPKLLDCARQWLDGALATLGVGAKTAAGYGLFDVKDFEPPPLPATRAEASFGLTLVTPAFLAGSAQGEEDCSLRGATLRGQLRWWWRTMHAAHLEPRVLRRLEAAVWGTSSVGSAVRILLLDDINTGIAQFGFNADDNSTFLRDNGIERSNKGVAESERRKTTQGLYYAAYGAMKDRRAMKPGRFFRQPGSSWKLRLLARASRFGKGPDDEPALLSADEVLQQANAALFLLTRYGGVGAKARKGFGSFADIELAGIAGIDDCRRVAKAFRELCGIATLPDQTDAPSLERTSQPLVVETKWTNAWFALNRIGEAMQLNSKTGKHKPWKAALGLPRKSDDVSAVRVKDDETFLQPWATIPMLGTIRLVRHAAPIHFHVAKAAGKLSVRLVTFVSKHLPDEKTSAERLDALRTGVRNQLERWKNDGGTARLSPEPKEIALHAPVVALADTASPRQGSRIQAELLEERTKNGCWKAKHSQSGEIGSIMNNHQVPPDKKVGELVELEYHSRGQFKWPVKAPPALPPRPGGPRGRR